MLTSVMPAAVAASASLRARDRRVRRFLLRPGDGSGSLGEEKHRSANTCAVPSIVMSAKHACEACLLERQALPTCPHRSCCCCCCRRWIIFSRPGLLIEVHATENRSRSPALFLMRPSARPRDARADTAKVMREGSRGRGPPDGQAGHAEGEVLHSILLHIGCLSYGRYPRLHPSYGPVGRPTRSCIFRPRARL